MTDRDHCRCVVVQNYSYAQAAAKLAVPQEWLERHVSRLPHQKFGGNAAVFCDCDLRVIQRMHTVLPPAAEAVLNPPEQTPAETSPDPMPAGSPLAAIKPAQRRRRVPART